MPGLLFAAAPTEMALLARIGVALGLAFVLGFERELRGAPAGDRTYALVGTAAAAVTAVCIDRSPQAVAGVLTGVGFVGAGLVFQGQGGTLKGITSAATLLAVVALGVVAGSGHLWLATAVGALILVDLELRHVPVLRLLDARRYTTRVKSDDDMPGMASPDRPAAGARPGPGR
ncbi:MAG: MgtC/SapB family protein [Acidimicrobiales bacterium]